MSAPLRQPEGPRDPALIELLLSVAPLLGVLRGEKRTHLVNAFTRAALNHGMDIMHTDDEGRLPVNPGETALALHAAVLDLCARAGVPKVELVQHYNHSIEQASFGPGSTGEAIERCLALVSIFYARSITTEAA